LNAMRGWARDDRQRAEVERVAELLRVAIETSRGLSHDLSPTVLHANDLAEALRWLVSRMRTRQGLTVHLEVSGEVTLASDALTILLFRAAQELLFNASKHAQVREARIRVHHRRRCVGMSVSDRGRGFDPQALQETGGFGLLSIRERVELLGGRMKIRSRPGQGSTFHILVPDGGIVAADVMRPWEPAGLATGPQQAPAQDGSRLRVLLADDHQIVRKGLVALLAEEGDIEVIAEAATGREAVELTDRLHPDVVIMDVSMPTMPGDEATRQIKAHQPRTRIVGLSMFGEADVVNRMSQAGAESHVAKTAPSEELLAAIRGKRVGVP
jgi:CheY-like chemotaxis protein